MRFLRDMLLQLPRAVCAERGNGPGRCGLTRARRLPGAFDAGVLRALADRYETRAFYEGDPGDPARFMHRAGSPASQEAMAFIASSLAFGSRRVFMPCIARIECLAGGDADSWIRSGRYKKFFRPASDGATLYRYVTCGDMRYLLDRYRAILDSHGTLGACVAQNCGGNARGALHALVDAFSKPADPRYRLVPKSLSSPCKRLCMFLRWMVRDGSPVDLGLWAGFVDKASLLVPLDTHVLTVARSLGLVSARTPTMKTAEALTDFLAKAFPGDPARGDYALYGLGLETAAKR